MSIISECEKNKQLIPGQTHILVNSHNSNAADKRFGIHYQVVSIYFDTLGSADKG